MNDREHLQGGREDLQGGREHLHRGRAWLVDLAVLLFAFVVLVTLVYRLRTSLAYNGAELLLVDAQGEAQQLGPRPAPDRRLIRGRLTGAATLLWRTAIFAPRSGVYDFAAPGVLTIDGAAGQLASPGRYRFSLRQGAHALIWRQPVTGGAARLFWTRVGSGMPPMPLTMADVYLSQRAAAQGGKRQATMLYQLVLGGLLLVLLVLLVVGRQALQQALRGFGRRSPTTPMVVGGILLVGTALVLRLWTASDLEVLAFEGRALAEARSSLLSWVSGDWLALSDHLQAASLVPYFLDALAADASVLSARWASALTSSALVAVIFVFGWTQLDRPIALIAAAIAAVAPEQIALGQVVSGFPLTVLAMWIGVLCVANALRRWSENSARHLLAGVVIGACLVLWRSGATLAALACTLFVATVARQLVEQRFLRLPATLIALPFVAGCTVLSLGGLANDIGLAQGRPAWEQLSFHTALPVLAFALLGFGVGLVRMLQRPRAEALPTRSDGAAFGRNVLICWLAVVMGLSVWEPAASATCGALALPAVLLLAAVGIDDVAGFLASVLRRSASRRPIRTLLSCAIVVGIVFAGALVHPYYHLFRNTLASFAGRDLRAADLAQGEGVKRAFDYLKRYAEPGDSVAIELQSVDHLVQLPKDLALRSAGARWRIRRDSLSDAAYRQAHVVRVLGTPAIYLYRASD
ncbi:MAG: hypothetical protein H6707_05650 [Deltaproteobacteria bacterium]|nr:hypothetical protein [Deltaproteobacteria bacterium]